MFKFPLMVPYAVVAFNITVFAVMLQMDVLIFHSPVAKAVTWAFAITGWSLVYVYRNKFLTFRFDKK